MLDQPDPRLTRIEHTLLAPAADAAAVVRTCEDAATHGFGGVCIAPAQLATAARTRKRLQADFRLITVGDFPHGAGLHEIRLAEARAAVHPGYADHHDILLPYGRFLDTAARGASFAPLRAELQQIVDAMAAINPAAELKVILETGALARADLIAQASALASDAGAHWIKTATGFGPRGASLDDIRVMRAAAPAHVRIKAAGGIRTLAQLDAFLAAGADAVGCSASCAIAGEIRDLTAALAS